MNEEGLLKWENILTILIGIVIVAFIYLIIYRRRVAKRKRLERDANILEDSEQTQRKDTSSHI